MTTLQSVALGATFVVVITSGIYQFNQTSKLRGQIETLQQQHASLAQQFEELKKHREPSARPIARAKIADEKPSPALSETGRPSSTNTPAARNPLLSPTLERDLAEALGEASPGRREVALKKLSETISRDDIPRALAIMAKSPGMNGAQSPLFSELATKWGNGDPTAASAWADSLTDPESRKAALVGVMKGWAGKAPEAAATYAAALSPPDVQEAAVMKVIGEWSFWNGADKAANWVQQLPAGSLRDKTMEPIIFWGTGQCPATIIDMLEATGDQQLILKHGETVATVWMDRDPPAARAWIAKSPLPEDVKARLLKPRDW